MWCFGADWLMRCFCAYCLPIFCGVFCADCLPIFCGVFCADCPHREKRGWTGDGQVFFTWLFRRASLLFPFNYRILPRTAYQLNIRQSVLMHKHTCLHTSSYWLTGCCWCTALQLWHVGCLPESSFRFVLFILIDFDLFYLLDVVDFFFILIELHLFYFIILLFYFIFLFYLFCFIVLFHFMSFIFYILFILFYFSYFIYFIYLFIYLLFILFYYISLILFIYFIFLFLFDFLFI